MRAVLGTVLVAVALPLAGCGLIPPSLDDVTGTYTADGATVIIDEDGSCKVSDFPASIAIDAKGALIPTDERFDAACTWELGSQLYSGAWELNVQADPPGGDHLFLDWIRPLGGAGCLMHSVGDPDSSAAWKLCPETD